MGKHYINANWNKQQYDLLHNALCTPLYSCISVKGSLCRCSHQSLHAMIINRTTIRAFGYLALSCFQAKYPNPNRNSFWQVAVSWEFFQILRALEDTTRMCWFTTTAKGWRAASCASSFSRPSTRSTVFPFHCRLIVDSLVWNKNVKAQLNN